MLPSGVAASGGVTSYALSPTFDMSFRLPVTVLLAPAGMEERHQHFIWGLYIYKYAQFYGSFTCWNGGKSPKLYFGGYIFTNMLGFVLVLQKQLARCMPTEKCLPSKMGLMTIWAHYEKPT